MQMKPYLHGHIEMTAVKDDGQLPERSLIGSFFGRRRIVGMPS